MNKNLNLLLIALCFLFAFIPNTTCQDGFLPSDNGSGDGDEEYIVYETDPIVDYAAEEEAVQEEIQDEEPESDGENIVYETDPIVDYAADEEEVQEEIQEEEPEVEEVQEEVGSENVVAVQSGNGVAETISLSNGSTMLALSSVIGIVLMNLVL